ncbi:hypothetical protein [Streptomyces sp. NPDC048521]|uniref:hypothetical protein n=1 Tax=Streptomyces sp. NPDC048521 TaxID=3365566 RepID=UPI0037203A4E
MDPFLTALSGKLADTWNTLLVVPGLLYVSVVAAAPVLGHGHPADVRRLSDRLDALAGNPATHSAGTVVLGAAFVLAASAAAGLLAGYLGGGVERLWLGEWPAPLRRIADALTRRRARRWQQAQERYEDAVRRAADRGEELPLPSGSGRSPYDTAPAETVVLNDARNRIGYAPPRRPTWMGDRLAAVDQRVLNAYQLDLSTAWPRLWMLLPAPARADLQAARDALTAAARRAGWGLLYLIPALWWWPAAPVSALLCLGGWRAARQAAQSYAELAESAVDLYARRLARTLGLQRHPGARLTQATGRQITSLLRKKT